jgi:hypothetical protein
MMEDAYDEECAYSRNLEQAMVELEMKAERLTQQLSDALAQRDAAFKMTKCECGPDECCQNLVRLYEQLAEARAAKTCEWSTDAEDGEVYETSCGRAWQFIDGDLTENSLQFCPFCGGCVKDVSHFLAAEAGGDHG